MQLVLTPGYYHSKPSVPVLVFFQSYCLWFTYSSIDGVSISLTVYVLL